MKRLSILGLLILFLCGTTLAQTREFTYQGRLVDNSMPANGTYEMRFRLFDAVAGGTQMPQPTPVTLDFTVANSNPVTVTNGSFTVKLDFGDLAFPGATRFLDISVRRSASDPFTPLNPRQHITSAPHSIKSLSAASADSLSAACSLCVTNAHIQSIDGSKVTGTVANSINATTATNATHATTATDATNAAQLGGIAANQYVQTGDPRMSDARNPLPNSSNYIQSNPATPQTGTSFDIEGDGRASVFNATGWFAFNGQRILSAPATDNLFAGRNAGGGTDIGTGNSFFGTDAGKEIQGGTNNSFFGRYAGNSNRAGYENAFFGYLTGQRNIGQYQNTFIGSRAGLNSGLFDFNLEAIRNTFVGFAAGMSNGTGSNNTALGASADIGSSGNIVNATAIGANSFVTQNNSLVLGGINGVNGATANTNVGIGTTAPGQRLHVVGNSLFNGDLTVGGTLNATLPSNSGSYIQNNPPSPQTGNFNISGNGLIGGNLGIGTGAVAPVARVQIVNGTADIRMGSPNADGIEIRSSATGHTPALTLTNTNANGRRYRIASYGDGAFPGRFIIRNDSDGNDLLSINFDGKIYSSVLNPSSAFVFNRTNTRFSGVSTEDFNQLINFGINTGREDNFNSSMPGYWLRADTRIGFQGFQFFRKAAGSGAESALMTIADSGNIGIGTAPTAWRLSIDNPGFNGLLVSTGTAGGSLAEFGANGEFNINSATFVGGRLKITENSTMMINNPPPNGTVITNTFQRLVVNGVIRSGLTGAGVAPICHSALQEMAVCVSSIAYKDNVRPFEPGLDLLLRLRPVSFFWKQNGMPDMGLIAEEVAATEPLLATYDHKGNIQGVKYDRVGIVAVNAIKEQQEQIEKQNAQIQAQEKKLQQQQERIARQQQQIDQQHNLIDGLKKLVCQTNPQASVCKEKQ